MNRSSNSILCRFGIHTADPYVHIQVKCRNGSHRWQSNYIGDRVMHQMIDDLARALTEGDSNDEA